MVNKIITKNLIKLADNLDRKGLHKEAEFVDKILKSAMFDINSLNKNLVKVKKLVESLLGLIGNEQDKRNERNKRSIYDVLDELNGDLHYMYIVVAQNLKHDPQIKDQPPIDIDYDSALNKASNKIKEVKDLLNEVSGKFDEKDEDKLRQARVITGPLLSEYYNAAYFSRKNS